MLEPKIRCLIALLVSPMLLLGCGNDAPPAVTDEGGQATPQAGTPAPAQDGTPTPTDRNPLLDGGGQSTPPSGTVRSRVIAADGLHVIANGLYVPVPEGWAAEPVQRDSMDIRQGQMRLGDIEGPEGVMAITGNIGGGVQNNIARWVSQIQQPVGEPAIEEIDLGDGLTLHTFRMEGAYHPGAMSPNAPVQANTLSLGAIVAGGPRGDVFFKLTASTDVLGPHEERWDAMLRGIRRAN